MTSSPDHQDDNLRFIGMMSGTSLDGVDGVIAKFVEGQPEPIIEAHIHQAFPPELKSALYRLCHSGDNEIELIAQWEPVLTDHYVEVVSKLLLAGKLSRDAITAIGNHGQTIRHIPQHGFTLQIGNPNQLAVKTGIPVVADFRRMDMAKGGQGAPLAPAFHSEVFRSPLESRVVLNLGGIANITYLNRESTSVEGFDTGPANALMDHWIQLHQQTSFDQDGDWARTGTVIPALLQNWKNKAYFKAPPPKSTGREFINPDEFLAGLTGNEHPADVQATLLQLTVDTVSDDIKHYYPDSKTLIVAGGGAFNRFLLSKLQDALPGLIVKSSSDFGVPPDLVEACAFAWLAKQRWLQKTANCTDVTGASEPALLGTVFQP